MSTKIKALQEQRERYPYRNEPLTLAFEAEIKRLAEEKGRTTASLMTKLAELSGVGESQLYNYRSGKTEIPARLVPKFCRQFGSNALAMAIVEACYEPDIEERDGFDLAQLTSQTIQDFLKLGDEFLTAMSDGRIDGHEYAKLAHARARIHRNAHRFGEVIDFEYRRRSA